MHGTIRLIARFLGLTVLLGLAAAPGMSAAEEEFLQPDQAFRISGEARGPDEIAVSWDITDGYYLYAGKIRLRSLTEGIEIGKPDLPKGETRQDEFFGAVEIYRGRVSVPAKLTRATGSAASLTLEATSQGCADAGLCYPPHRQRLVLELPAAAATQAPTTRIAAAPARVPPPVQAPEQALPKAAPITGRSQLNQALGLGGDDDILDPEDAFRFDPSVAGPDRLHLLWGIADGTYLYQDKLHIAIEGAPDVALGAFEWPAPEIKKDSILPDGSTGDVAVYHGGIDVVGPPPARFDGPSPDHPGGQVPGVRRARPVLPAHHQAGDTGPARRCPGSDPQRGPVPSRKARPKPAPTAALVSAPAPEAMVSEQDQIAAVLAGGNLWAIVALFFGFGLLLALTPCVFPMIPILSGIIAGHGAGITTRKAFTLSLVYVLAMAATYTVAGVLAGLFGANIQAAFQNPWILSVFAAIFVALALSMFGFYEIQLPSALQSRVTEMSNRQQGGSLVGVAIMGLLSALIVGPCVAPPLAGALIFIGQTGDAVLGGAALFAMSLGMGVPLIAIGTSAGKYLPRAGAWMDAVKAVFGVLLLGVAIMLLERVLPAAVSLLLWGLLAHLLGRLHGRHRAPPGPGRRLDTSVEGARPRPAGLRRPDAGRRGRRRQRHHPAPAWPDPGGRWGYLRRGPRQLQAHQDRRRSGPGTGHCHHRRPACNAGLLCGLVCLLQRDGALHLRRSGGDRRDGPLHPAPGRRHRQ